LVKRTKGAIGHIKWPQVTVNTISCVFDKDVRRRHIVEKRATYLAIYSSASKAYPIKGVEKDNNGNDEIG